MPLISFSSLAKSYGAHDVFRNLSGSIPYGTRLALLGPNGSGKTTLLRILGGMEQADSGRVYRARGLRFGYLPQESAWTGQDQAARDASLWEAMLPAFAELLARALELAQLEAAMADPNRREVALEKYGHLQHQFERDGGYAHETQIKQVLHGLGFGAGDFQRPLSQLSGGQRTRALLARLLLEQPDLLLLDEPTNHLDIAAVEWLEGWLRGWGGAVLLVSHDRYFLDQTIDTIWELHFEQLETYRGGYSAYVAQRQERRERQQKEHQAQHAYIQKEQEYIRRNIAGQNTRQAQGRRRQLERLLREQHANDRLVAQVQQQRGLHIDMEAELRSGDRVLETNGLVVGYPDDGQPLFRAPDLVLLRSELAALIGPNGAGKTTFLKTLLGELPPLQGMVRLGASLRIGYFAQAHEGLRPSRTLLQEIQSVRELSAGEVRNYLAQFLFTGEDVFKKVEFLSGGERGRLALAKLALEGANFLLLDEPTNHLDIPAQEVLEEVLSGFPGTILLVSHDRYLIDRVATQIWSLEDGELIAFQGSYGEFAGQRRERVPDASPPERPDGRQGRDGLRARRQAEREARRQAERAVELEAAIDGLEGRLAALERELEAAGVAQDVERVRTVGEKYERLQAELAGLMAEWEAVVL